MDSDREIPKDVKKAALYLLALKQSGFMGRVSFFFDDQARIQKGERVEFFKIGEQECRAS